MSKIFGVLLLLACVTLVACAQEEQQKEEGCFEILAICEKDTDCCTNYCEEKEAEFGFCKERPDKNGCLKVDQICGRDEHCCSGYCEDVGSTIKFCGKDEKEKEETNAEPEAAE